VTQTKRPPAIPERFKVPNNSTFSVNRLRGFHESEILVIFSGAVVPSLVSGFVKGEG
jgi:hypothetical protein